MKEVRVLNVLKQNYNFWLYIGIAHIFSAPQISASNILATWPMFTISAGSVRGHIKNIHKGHKHFKCDSCGKLLISKSLTEFILVNDFPQKSHL